MLRGHVSYHDLSVSLAAGKACSLLSFAARIGAGLGAASTTTPPSCPAWKPPKRQKLVRSDRVVALRGALGLGATVSGRAATANGQPHDAQTQFGCASRQEPRRRRRAAWAFHRASGNVAQSSVGPGKGRGTESVMSHVLYRAWPVSNARTHARTEIGNFVFYFRLQQWQIWGKQWSGALWHWAPWCLTAARREEHGARAHGARGTTL